MRTQSAPFGCAPGAVARAALAAACAASLVAPWGDRARAEPAVVQLAEPPLALSPAIDFLPGRPAIDGLLDSGLERLPARSFTLVWKSSAENAVEPAFFRLAYGTDFFYVWIETGGDSLVHRDRAYQNGDGFALLLGAARENGEPTDEFYVLACSAVDRPQMEWSRLVFWYYNVEHLFVPTGPGMRLEARAANGRIGFELLLPWSEVRPYHPWISSGESAARSAGESGDGPVSGPSRGIGFALTFTRAVGERDRNIHLLLADEIGAEMSPRRYARLEFRLPGEAAAGAQPASSEAMGSGTTASEAMPPAAMGLEAAPLAGVLPQTFLSAVQGHIASGDSIRILVATAAPRPGREAILVRLLSGEGRPLAWRQYQYDCAAGLNRIEASFPVRNARPGGYRLAWQSQIHRDSRGEWGLSVLPPFPGEEISARLAALPAGIAAGTATTLAFLADELDSELTELRPYETSADLRMRLEDLLAMLAEAERGHEPLADRTGFVRRAFRSALDGSLQPYGVRFTPSPSSQRWPLLVFLHGSASDETHLESFPFLAPPGVLALGPFGRGPSNAFATREAQADIAEAIADAARNYPVDPTCAVVAGFSMGGYGALRTFWEHPERFRGVAVFAGHPDLGDRTLPGSGQPDFRDEENLAVFRGVPVFLYHGEADRNLPLEDALALAEGLRRAGARVEVHTEPGKGHEQPGPATIAAYQRWLLATLRDGE